jgi:SAM-dependent methyltransferase
MLIRTPHRVSPRWEDPRTVAGFTSAAPNANLLAFARRLLERRPGAACLDLGCGAARNALPLAALGFRVTATDLSVPMLDAARARIDAESPGAAIELVHAPMAPLPFADAAFDLVVAHGIWNLARSDGEFRRAIREAARTARHNARLFVFTFSRHTLPESAAPLAGHTLTYTQFSGQPQIFVTADQLRDELSGAGFVPDPALPLRELNLPAPGETRIGGPPVIFEGGFRFSGA